MSLSTAGNWNDLQALGQGYQISCIEFRVLRVPMTITVMGIPWQKM